MRIQNSNLINSLYGQSINNSRMSAQARMNNSVSGNSAGKNPYSGWVTGSANIDADSHVSVRKQMQDQIRNLFEKERANTSPLFAESSDAVNGTDKEEDKKEDKLLNSGKIYNFKEVSNKIMHAKTAVSAGQAVIAAKRKVSELKRKIAAAGDDGDELQMALTHARKMEVVAERKKNNLTLEEMIANTQKRDELQKKMEETASSMEKAVMEEVKDEIMDKQLEHIDEQAEIMREETEKIQEEMAEKIEETQEEMTEQMSSFVDEMSDKESEMLREMSEMIDAMEIVDPHMSEEELNRLKTKHRFSEQKALMKADMDYLKDVFKQIDGRNHAAMPGMNNSTSMGSFASFGGGISPMGGAMLSVDSGGSDAPAPSVDVSV